MRLRIAQLASRIAFAAALVAGLSSCGGATEVVPSADPPVAPPAVHLLSPTDIDGDRCLKTVAEFITISNRVSGTAGAARAADYLAAALSELGLDAEIDEFTAPTPAGEMVFRNVIGRHRGTGPGVIVVGSHYDIKGGVGDDFVGANDSGSSTGLLLELARALGAAPPLGATILTTFFDGEECQRHYSPNDGLHGSRRMAARLLAAGDAENVRAVIILDMIGDADLSVTLPRNNTPELTSLVLAAAREENVRSKFALHRGAILDDHVPFLRAGMPAVDIIDFQFGSAPGRNDYWHTEADTLDKLSAQSLESVGRVVVRTINALLQP